MLHWISQNSIRDPKKVPSMVVTSHNSILLDSYLDFRAIRRALRSWFSNHGYLRKKIKDLTNSAPEGCPQFIIAHLKRDLKRTVYGDLALEYSLQREMIRSFAQNVSPMSHTVIASENFPIECDLHDALKPKTIGNFILFAHGGVRPWDLKYSRFPNSSGIPQPASASVDRAALLAINGDLDRLSLKEMGGDLAHVVEVEALRFLSLANPQRSEPISGVRATKGPLRLLVLGDYLHAPTLEVCRLVESVLPTLKVETSLMFRPHPLVASRDKDVMRTGATSLSGTLDEDLSQADVIISTATSSSGLGAILAGKTVVTIVSPTDLNYAPQAPGVRFVRDARQLADAIMAARLQPPPIQDIGLHLDPSLHRWRRLLSD